MNNKHRLTKKYLNMEVLYIIGCLLAAIISAQVINYFMDANTSGFWYQFLIWLIPINSFLVGFWILINFIARRCAVIKKFLHACIVAGEISYLLRLLIYLITGKPFDAFMADLIH